MESVDPANILVLGVVIVFISLVVYGAVQSRLQEKKNKSNENKK